LTAERDLDRLAETALTLVDRIRDDDPNRLRNELEGLCTWHPVKAAQLIMCYLAWFDPELNTAQLGNRAMAVAEDGTQLLRRPLLEPLDFADCGTERQAARHRRRGEKPCAACRQAETRARADRQRRTA
jgi:hypothetical protein